MSKIINISRMPIELITRSDIVEFVEIASNCRDEVLVKDGKYCGNGKSLLNMLATVEWDNLYVETSTTQISKFEKFCK